jgi:hypothetical protein
MPRLAKLPIDYTENEFMIGVYRWLGRQIK